MEQERQCCSKGLNTGIAYRSNEIDGLQDRLISYVVGRGSRGCGTPRGMDDNSGRSRGDLRRLQLIHLIDTALDLIDDYAEHDCLRDETTCRTPNTWTTPTLSSCHQPCSSTPPLSFPDLFHQEEQSSSTIIDDMVCIVDLCGNDHLDHSPRIMIPCPTTERRGTITSRTIPEGEIITAPIPPTTTIIEDGSTSTELPRTDVGTLSRQNKNQHGK